jgi:hypothetical protein
MFGEIILYFVLFLLIVFRLLDKDLGFCALGKKKYKIFFSEDIQAFIEVSYKLNIHTSKFILRNDNNDDDNN